MAKNCTRPGCERGTYKEFCLYHAPKKPIPVRTALPRPTKRIKQRGKQYDIWQAVRSSWVERHPAVAYICHYCRKPVPPSELTLDHKRPKSRYDKDRHEDTNLVPCCFACNGAKGSIEHDKYPHLCPDTIAV